MTHERASGRGSVVREKASLWLHLIPEAVMTHDRPRQDGQAWFERVLLSGSAAPRRPS